MKTTIVQFPVPDKIPQKTISRRSSMILRFNLGQLRGRLNVGDRCDVELADLIEEIDTLIATRTRHEARTLFEVGR